MNTCRKCNGTGHLPQFANVDGGRCWSCGPGNDVRYYTEAEFDAIMHQRSIERAARRAAREAAKQETS